jgi:ferrous iron transport protein A
MTLRELPLCQTGHIAALAVEGGTLRRMLELGLIPGTAVTPLFRSPTGSPTAYWIRGAVIALRRDLASQIYIDS